MRKKLLIASSIAGILVLIFTVVVLYNHPAFANNQEKQVNTSNTGMEIYSDPTKKQSKEHVRKSRLKQMNIIGEAATVLNVLPITIIDEMHKGKTLSQIAQEKGLTENEFTKALSDLETKTVNEAVKTGTITQKHKDAIDDGKSERIKNALKIKEVDVHDHAPMDMGN